MQQRKSGCCQSGGRTKDIDAVCCGLRAMSLVASVVSSRAPIPTALYRTLHLRWLSGSCECIKILVAVYDMIELRRAFLTVRLLCRRCSDRTRPLMGSDL
jgi:hypothetical protein